MYAKRHIGDLLGDHGLRFLQIRDGCLFFDMHIQADTLQRL